MNRKMVLKKSKVGSAISSVWFSILHNLDRHHAKFEGPRWLGSASYGLPFFQRVASKRNTCKMIQRPYLSSWATNQKTKVTFFSLTFKVWESKCPYFLFVAQEPRYWQFLPNCNGRCCIKHEMDFICELGPSSFPQEQDFRFHLGSYRGPSTYFLFYSGCPQLV